MCFKNPKSKTMSPLFEKAVPYILGIIVKDETIKTFPAKFVAESAKWVKS